MFPKKTKLTQGHLTERGKSLLSEPTQQDLSKQDMIRVNGRAQVLDLLRVADPEFRETLLRNIERRNPKLARELREEI
ncbi:MAG: hypothetical protein AB7F43_11180 [Bacteriovoracia bacterium]